MSEKEREEPIPQQILVPVEWYVPDNIKNAYADNVTAQPRRHDIIISFFETQPPVLGGNAEQNRALLEKLPAIRAECVGKVVVAAELIPDIINVLQIAYNGYLATKTNEESRNA